MRGLGNVFQVLGVLAVMQERRSSSLCVDWMDAKRKKDIIDNMHEHKVYQQILEQQHLNIIISLSFGNDSGI